MIIRDFYFAAFLITSGFIYQVISGKLHFDLSKTEFFRQQKAFEESGFKRHHEIVKSLIASTSQDASYSQLSD